jgi:hypothetical protein
MKTRTFSILAVLAVVLVGAAIIASNRGETGAATPRDQGSKFFGDLAGHVNDVTEIDITAAEPEPEPPPPNPDGTPAPAPTNPPGGTKTFVIQKQGDAWGAAEKGGYPVDASKVKQLVVGISEFTTLSEMTKVKSSYNKLGVEDITEPKAESKRVTLKDSSGKVLADVLIGKPKVSQNFGGKPALYVRRVGDEQAFEVSGNLTVATDASSWLDREVSKVESARVNRVVTAHPGGETLTVEKTKPDDQNFSVAGLPTGEELMWPGVANGIASSLQYLSLEDVKKNENFDTTEATTTEFTTYDGMRVIAKSVEKDGKTWMTLSAAFDPALVVPEPATVEPPKPEEGAPPTPTPPKPVRKTAEEVQKEVEAFNKKVSPWVFAVPGYAAANMRKHMTDLLKKKEEPKPAGEGDAAIGGDGLPVMGDPAPPPVKKDDAQKDETPPPADKPADEKKETPPA